MLGIIYHFPLICSGESNLNQSKVGALLFSFRSRLSDAQFKSVTNGTWKNGKKRKLIFMWKPQPLTVKRRSKNFSTVQTRTSGEVSAKLLLWWNEKYPFRNAKIVVKNRTFVYCLLTRMFSLKSLHVLTQTFYTNPRTLREVLPCTFPLWELREPVGLLTQVYSGSIWRTLARSYYAHFMSNIFPKLHFKNMLGCSKFDPYVHWEYVKVIRAQLRVTLTNRTQKEGLGCFKY